MLIDSPKQKIVVFFQARAWLHSVYDIERYLGINPEPSINPQVKQALDELVREGTLISPSSGHYGPSSSP